MRRVSHLAAVGASLLLGLALPAFGQMPVTVTFNGGGSTTWNGGPDGNVYAGIYNGSVSGIAGAHPGIICDDYKDSIVAGESWSGTAINAASLNTSNIGNTMFGSSIGLGGYAEVATLVSQIFSGTSMYSQAELASAIWYITGQYVTPSGLISLSSLDSAAQGLVASLQSEFGGASNLGSAEAALSGFGNLWIVTPAVAGPQEMWVSAPEGGAAWLYLLLALAVSAGAFFARYRGRTVAQGLA